MIAPFLWPHIPSNYYLSERLGQPVSARSSGQSAASKCGGRHRARMIGGSSRDHQAPAHARRALRDRRATHDCAEMLGGHKSVLRTHDQRNRAGNHDRRPSTRGRVKCGRNRVRSNCRTRSPKPCPTGPKHQGRQKPMRSVSSRVSFVGGQQS